MGRHIFQSHGVFGYPKHSMYAIYADQLGIYIYIYGIHGVFGYW